MLEKRFLFLLLVLLGCYREKPRIVAVSSPDFEKAIAFEDKQPDSAFYYFNKAATGSKDSLLTARAYNNMAEIQTDAGDYFGSQETVTTSLKFLNDQKTSNYHCLSADYNELGINSFSLKNYTAAIGYYDLAVKFSDSSQWTTIYLNNKANAYQQNKDYIHAIKIYREVLAKDRPRGIEYARVLSNMATTKWLQNQHYDAAPEFLRALAIRLKENDQWGQNSSYSHLADYYTGTHQDSALFYVKKMYAVATRINSPDDRLEALQKLIRLGPPYDAKRYFERYQSLNDSVQTARNAAKNQFALIRYESEKNKAEKFKFQQESIKKNIWLYGILITFVLLAVAAWFGYRKREQRLEAEARQRELRLSQRVHDEVSNGIYRVIKRIEHNEDSNRDILLIELAELYEQSRDISYERTDPIGSFEEKIDQLLAGLAGASVQVTVAGNHAALWESVSLSVKRQLLPILQELMVNMRKHSGATSVTFSFKIADNRLHIQYTDNGKGFPPDAAFGNGLNHTVSRMEGLGGTFTFDPSSEKGLKIFLGLPL